MKVRSLKSILYSLLGEVLNRCFVLYKLNKKTLQRTVCHVGIDCFTKGSL